MRMPKQMFRETPKGLPKGIPKGLPKEPPTTLLEYCVYALGFVILCALLAAFYFIDTPMAFRRFW